MIRMVFIIIGAVVAVAAIASITVFKEKIKSAFYIGHMESDNRIKQMKVDQIIARLNINKGDRVADIGAGSGLFSRKLSAAVSPEGMVFSVDVNRELLRHIDGENAALNIGNIKTVAAREDDPMIPEPVNLIFICDTLHYIDRQEQYVKKMAGYLHAGGTIAVVSFQKTWPPLSNKFTDKDCTAWMEKAGLTLIHYYDDIIQDQYLALYKKK